MIEHIGALSETKLEDLLESGYLVYGKQRITQERNARPFSRDYRLWDDWKQQKYHCGANSISTLIQMEHIDNIEEWSWYPNINHTSTN